MTFIIMIIIIIGAPRMCHEDTCAYSVRCTWRECRQCNGCPGVRSSRPGIPDDNTATDWLRRSADDYTLDQSYCTLPDRLSMSNKSSI